MNDQRDLEGLSALVTGATSGIGKAAAEELGRHGAEIVVHGRDADRGSAVAGDLDLISDTFDAETERLLSLGAQRLRDVQRDKARWTTFADIEGNEFDVIAG